MKKRIISFILTMALIVCQSTVNPVHAGQSKTEPAAEAAPATEAVVTNVPTTSPTPAPTATPTPTKRPTPTPAVKMTNTQKTMSGIDYYKSSLTGISTKKLSKAEMKKLVGKYGTLYGTGMSLSDYKKAMQYKWIDCTDYIHKPVKVSVDITKTIDYDTYEKILKKLSRYDGVYLYKIGESQQGRNIYAIEIDVDSTKEKDTFIFTGQVHAREFAGGTYLIKMFADLIQKAQTDEKTMKLLKKYKYAAIPIINVDGRQALIDDPDAWTTSSGMWKAYINGTDGNRNYPGVLWGEVAKGNTLKWNISLKPSSENYSGKTAGSCPETKAVMKFIYHYTVVEKALCLLDMHQQGRAIYAGKEWPTEEQENDANKLRNKVLSFLNKNNSSKYKKADDEPKYGLNGTGSTITDYAVSVASGAKFSPAYGFSAYTDGKNEYIMMELGDLDNAKFKVDAPNPHFSTLTVEIGCGKRYLGNSQKTRNLLASEYTKYHFDKLLESLPNLTK